MRKEPVMQITLEVSEDIAQRLALTSEGLSRAALEALAIEGARSGKLTTDQVRRLLGFSTRYEADGNPKRRRTWSVVSWGSRPATKPMGSSSGTKCTIP